MAIIRKQDNIKNPVKVATTANITLSGIQVIDGVTLIAGDRVLVKDQTNKTLNGVYEVSSNSWNRASDYDNISEIVIGSLIYVTEGLVNKESFWMLTTEGNGPFVIDMSNIYFKKATGEIYVNETSGLQYDSSGFLSLTNTGIAPGSYAKLTVDIKGRVTGNSTLTGSDIPSLDWSKIATGKPNTLSGYGITDGINTSDVVTTATANKILKLDSNGLLPTGVTGNAGTATKLATARNISLSGDISGSVLFDGSANTSITTALANSGVTAGTYPKVTVNAKGLVTGSSTLTAGDIPSLTLSKITDAGTAASKNTGTASGNVPILDTNGKLDAGILPAIAITDTFVVTSQTAMLALTAQTGDVAIRTDLNKNFILKGTDPTLLASWQELLTPTDAVTSVAGKTGVVTLTSSDVGLGNVTNESKATMFTSPTFTGTPISTTPTTADNSTKVATTAFVKAQNYLTGNQSVTVTGDVTGSGATAITLTLADSGVAAGTYTKVTVDSKGRVTGNSVLSASDIPSLDWGKIATGTPTTLSGYGITDAVASTDVVTTAAASKILKLDTSGLLPTGITGNAATATKLVTARTLATSGDATGSISFDGSANVTIPLVLANSGVTVGTYKSVTVDAKGRVTAGTNPTTLSGYGITDGVNTSDVVTTAAANKILKLDANGSLPTGITGNSATTTKLATARTISTTGDATGSASFDGSTNASITLTLANSGVSTGTYSKVTVDAKGRVTAGSNITASDLGALVGYVGTTAPANPPTNMIWIDTN
ncbi:hypothetical protein D3C75_435490 [compost metagenome]